EAKFRYVVLLDDFSGSGTSFVREDGSGGWTGKIAKIVENLMTAGNLGGAIADGDVKVIIVLYVAADQAIDHIEQHLPKLSFGKGTIAFHV
ncbi:hypothetical protein ACI394_28465, partial [Klebsiella pneumoniae]|uniref:hypothetical protein n=1 Tax=Klebsiella pneumoniae TaxID=573 RepID=UPI00385189B2